MKKRFALLMAALLCGVMFAMPALAELGTVQGTLQTYQPISNVDFDESYYGFCLMLDRRAAAPGDKFTITQTKDNANNKEGKDISNALKVLVVEYFDEFFSNGFNYTVDSDGNYKMTAQKASKFQSAVYRLVDREYDTSADIIKIVNDVLEKAVTMPIKDRDYKTLSNGTEVVFDFKVFKTTQGVGEDGRLQQDFIGFKVANKPAGEDSDPDGPNADDLDDVVRQLPKTGDNTSLTLWALMMAGCLTALTALNRRAKRGN